MSSNAPECILAYIRGDFLLRTNGLRKARERELATLDETLTSSGMAKTLCAIQIGGKNRGEEGTTHVTTACPESETWKCAITMKNYVAGGKV